MAQRIIMKKTAVPGIEPNPLLDLMEGEIGVNIADGRLWIRSSDTVSGDVLSNQVVEIGGVEPGSRIKNAIDVAVAGVVSDIPSQASVLLNGSRFTTQSLDLNYNRTTSGISSIGFYNGAAEYTPYASITREAGGSGNLVITNTGTGNLRVETGGHYLVMNPTGVGIDVTPSLGSAIFQVSNKLVVPTTGGLTIRADSAADMTALDFQLTSGASKFSIRRVSGTGMDGPYDDVMLRSHTGVLKLQGLAGSGFGLNVYGSRIESSAPHAFLGNVTHIGSAGTSSLMEILPEDAYPSEFPAAAFSKRQHITFGDSGVRVALGREPGSTEKRSIEFVDEAYRSAWTTRPGRLLARIRSAFTPRTTAAWQDATYGVVDSINTPVAMAAVRFSAANTATIIGGVNVTSCTREGVGRYRLTFASPMPSTSYYAHFSYGSGLQGHGVIFQENLRPASYGQAVKDVNGFPFTCGNNEVDQIIDVSAFISGGGGVEPIMFITVYHLPGLFA